MHKKIRPLHGFGKATVKEFFMKCVQRSLVWLMTACCLCLAGCAAGRGEGQTVLLSEDGGTRRIPARCFNEAAYLERGYLKNTTAQGETMYVFISETDRPYEPTMGNPGQGILWYGDRGGGQGRGGLGAVGLSGGKP